MRFSVIIPVYNAVADLPQALESVLQQSFTDWEILLCEDGSTDGETPALCDAYAARMPGKIRVIHRPNGGPGAARNTGLDAAVGEYICFLDSDDHLAPQALELLNQKLRDTDADLIELGFYLEREGAILKIFPPAAPTDRVVTLAETPRLMISTTSPWRRIYRREFFVRSGVRFPEGVLVAEDLRTTLRLLPLAKSISAVPDCLYYYVDRPGSVTRQGETTRNAQVIEAFDDICAWYRSNGFYEPYHAYLEKLAVEHLLLATSVRVLRADPKSALLEEIQAYMHAHFPSYMTNPLVAELSGQQKLALKLIRGRKYGAVKALFAVKDRLS